MSPRSDAKAVGQKRYFTGKPCKHGHICERLTYSGSCIECARAVSRKIASRYYKKNKTKCIAYSTQWRKDNPEKFKEIMQRSHKKCRKQRQEYGAKYRVENAEKMQGFRHAWAAANSEKLRANVRNRRARKRAAEGRHTAEDTKAIWHRQEGLCGHCRKSLVSGKTAHVDHIMPLELGGSNWPENLQWLCRKCNDSKGWLHPTDFVRRTGRMFMCWIAE